MGIAHQPLYNCTCCLAKMLLFFLLTQETWRNRGTKALIECECTRGPTHRGISWFLCFGSVADQNLIPVISLRTVWFRSRQSAWEGDLFLSGSPDSLLVVDLLNNHEHKLCIHQNQKTIEIYPHASLGQHQLEGWTSPGFLWLTAELLLWVRVHNWTNGPDATFMLALLLFADQLLKFTKKKIKNFTDLLTYLLTYWAQLWPVTSAKASQPQVKHHSLNTERRGNLPTSWAGLEPVNAHGIYKFGINAFIC